MTVVEKVYSLPPEVLKNAIYDIAEMRKAKIRSSPGEAGSSAVLEMTTEMYKIKTVYSFNLLRDQDGTKISIETGGDDESAKQDVALMFAILDGIIYPVTMDQEEACLDVVIPQQCK